MDPKRELPEIKVEVNKDTEENREEGKKGGFLTQLLGGSAQGGGGLGGLADVGAAAGSGGLLATKAGMLALILVGTTLAGSVGLIGYRFLGPGQDDQGGDSYQVFAPKPKPAPNANGAGAASKDGSSQSLSMFAQANADQSKPAGGGDQTPADQAAASAASAAPTRSGGATGSINGSADASAGASRHPANNAKFGQMGSSFGGGGGGGSAGSAVGPKGGIATASIGGTGGSLSGSSHGLTGARTSVGSSGGMNRASGALGQGFGVLRDNRGATSSFAAGRTYDGSATNTGGVIGGGGTGIGGDGVGAGAGLGQGKSTPNTALPSSKIEPPPAAPTTPVVPWQADIQMAEILMGVGVLLIVADLFLVKNIPDPYKRIVKGLISLALSVISLMLIAIGVRLCVGQYAQSLQGGMIIAGGVGMAAAAAACWADTASSTAASIPYVMAVGGALPLIALVGTMMAPPKSYPPSQFSSSNPPPGQSFSFSN